MHPSFSPAHYPKFQPLLLSPKRWTPYIVSPEGPYSVASCLAEPIGNSAGNQRVEGERIGVFLPFSLPVLHHASDSYFVPLRVRHPPSPHCGSPFQTSPSHQAPAFTCRPKSDNSFSLLRVPGCFSGPFGSPAPVHTSVNEPLLNYLSNPSLEAFSFSWSWCVEKHKIERNRDKNEWNDLD